MAVFRVEKNENYTVMANYHLRDKSLSLKAKGLLSLMLSLPDDWDYTTKGLAKICRDGLDSVQATVRELEGAGYLRRERMRDAHGRLAETEYTILERPEKPEDEAKAEVTESSPKRENPVLVNPPKRVFPVLEKPARENPCQLNTKVLNTKNIKTGSSSDAPAKEKSSGSAETACPPAALDAESEEVKRLVANATAELMRKYGNGKRPAPFDEETAYRAMLGENGFDRSRLPLLEYAFEQAASQGCRGKWSYVLGVLRRLDEQGIRTVEAAKAAEASRAAEKARKPRPPERGRTAIYGTGELGAAELEAIQRVLKEGDAYGNQAYA